MRIAVDLPDDLGHQVLAIARDTQWTVSETVADLVRRGLDAVSASAGVATDPRTGLPVINVGTVVTADDVDALEDDD